MEPKAQLLVAPFFESAITSGNPDPQAFMRYLDSIFLDPNQAKRAADQLRTTRQRPNESFALFLPRFERILAEANMMAAPEHVKINYLEGAVSSDLRRALISVTVPEEYPAFVRTLLTIGSRLDSLAFFDRATNRSSRPPPAPAASPTPSDSMDWEPTIRASKGRLSTEEREERFRKGLCFYCGDKGHRRVGCPKASRSPQPARVRAATVATPQESHEDLVNLTSDSEKE
jgi:hypothetical protein